MKKKEPSRIVIDKEKCPKHPRYKAMRPPRTDCPNCWLIYNRKYFIL